MFDHFRADLHRYRTRGPLGTLRLMLETQGLWACACYRAGRHLNDHRPPSVLRRMRTSILTQSPCPSFRASQ